MNHVVCAIFCLAYLVLHAFEIHPSCSNISVLHLFLWISYTHGTDIPQLKKSIHAIFLAVVNIAAVNIHEQLSVGLPIFSFFWLPQWKIMASHSIYRINPVLKPRAPLLNRKLGLIMEESYRIATNI